MVKYKMKFFGRCRGKETGFMYSFQKNSIIEAPKGEFDSYHAEVLDEKKEVKKGSEKAETASIEPKSEKR